MCGLVSRRWLLWLVMIIVLGVVLNSVWNSFDLVIVCFGEFICVVLIW